MESTEIKTSTALTRPLTPQEQAEQERLQRILDDLNTQIDDIVAQMEQQIAEAMRAAAQRSMRQIGRGR